MSALQWAFQILNAWKHRFFLIFRKRERKTNKTQILEAITLSVSTNNEFEPFILSIIFGDQSNSLTSMHWDIESIRNIKSNVVMHTKFNWISVFKNSYVVWPHFFFPIALHCIGDWIEFCFPQFYIYLMWRICWNCVEINHNFPSIYIG